MTWDETLAMFAPCVPTPLIDALKALPPDALREMRLRADQPARLCCEDGVHTVDVSPTARQLTQICEALADHSLYARSMETAQGYVTLRGGHRMGLCGQVHLRDGVPVLTHIGSACVRIARERIGCGEPLLPFAMDGMLLIGPPGSGKTTLLRDLARLLSLTDEAVAIMDERCELSACVEGAPQLNVGCADVLCGMAKPDAARWLIRSMSPRFLLTDEIAAEADASALMDAHASGTAILASIHGRSLNEVVRRAAVKPLIAGRCFGSYAVLAPDTPGHVAALYDRSGSPLSLP